MPDDSASELTQSDVALKGPVKINAPIALGRLHIAPLLTAVQIS